MKTQQEIQQLAFLKYPRLINDPYNPMEDDNVDERQIYIDAYTQCQEDMVNEMEKCVRFFLKHTQRQITDRIAKESPKDFDVAKEVVKFYINSLNKQD